MHSYRQQVLSREWILISRERNTWISQNPPCRLRGTVGSSFIIINLYVDSSNSGRHQLSPRASMCRPWLGTFKGRGCCDLNSRQYLRNKNLIISITPIIAMVNYAPNLSTCRVFVALCFLWTSCPITVIRDGRKSTNYGKKQWKNNTREWLSKLKTRRTSQLRT